MMFKRKDSGHRDISEGQWIKLLVDYARVERGLQPTAGDDWADEVYDELYEYVANKAGWKRRFA